MKPRAVSSRLLFCPPRRRHAPCPFAARFARLSSRPRGAADANSRDGAGDGDQLRERALADDTGWKVVESLTTEVGPRLAGSEADARAVQWAVAKFKELGFDKVWTEPVTFPKWERRGEHAEVLGAHAQPLMLTALGGSPAARSKAKWCAFPTSPRCRRRRQVRLRARSRSSITDAASAMAATTAMAAVFAATVRSPRSAPARRVPHAFGRHRFASHAAYRRHRVRRWPDPDPVGRAVLAGRRPARAPAGAGPMRVRVALDCGWNGEATSSNVIGEITGSKKPKEIVLIGGHLDSWDLGTGAIDDAAGIGITMAAGTDRRRRSTPRARSASSRSPTRNAACTAARHTPARIRTRSSGTDRGRERFRRGPHLCVQRQCARRAAGAQQIADVLAPLGIESRPDKAARARTSVRSRKTAWRGHGCDRTAGLLRPAPHADDTLDKIDPKALAQNVAAYACSRTWRRRPTAISGARPSRPRIPRESSPRRRHRVRFRLERAGSSWRAGSTAPADSAVRVAHAQRFGAGKSCRPHRFQQIPAEMVEAQRATAHRITVILRW